MTQSNNSENGISRMEQLHEENQQLLDQLNALREENERLKRGLEESESMREFHAFQIYEKARNYFWTFIGFVTIVFVIFGVFSFKGLINRLEEVVLSEKNISKINSNLQEKVQDDVANQASANVSEDVQVVLMPVILSKVEQAIANALKEEEKSATSSESKELYQAIQKALVSEGKFVVIAGSSPRRENLNSELSRVQGLIGRQKLESDYPGLTICKPKAGNRNYAIVLISENTLDAAKKVREQAIIDGFRFDTYVLSIERVFFQYPNGCQKPNL